jgi:hypothetical protein
VIVKDTRAPSAPRFNASGTAPANAPSRSQSRFAEVRPKRKSSLRHEFLGTIRNALLFFLIVCATSTGLSIIAEATLWGFGAGFSCDFLSDRAQRHSRLSAASTRFRSKRILRRESRRYGHCGFFAMSFSIKRGRTVQVLGELAALVRKLRG